MEAGGAERVVTMLVIALSLRGHRVALAAPKGPRDADLRDVQHRRFIFPDGGRTAIGAAQTALALGKAVRSFSPDILHAQNVKSAITARAGTLAVRGGHRPPIVVTFHGVLPREYARSAWLLRSANHVACVSRDLRSSIVSAGLPDSRASLVRNAVTMPEPLDDISREALDRELLLGAGSVVTIVGRLVPQKAHHRFVVAARHIASELPETRFLVVGDGPQRSDIERQITAAGLSEHVRLTGVRADARNLIARSDVVVFSSDWEGLSLVALEALAAGTPVVSTDIQGMHELLDGGAGAIVPLDGGVALGRRVVQVLRDDVEREAMATAGRALIAREFSLDSMVDAYERLYGALVEPANGTLQVKSRV
jgi:glycosyltransferase involved in cell wall biosynthesis